MARPSPASGPSRSRPACLFRSPRCRRSARARVEGPAAPVGPRLPPDVLVPGELPGGPHPRLHRPLSRARRRRPGSVLRARHDAAAGLRGGSDRGRQRPQPVRPPADRGQGRAGDGPRLDPAGPASPPGRSRRPAGWRWRPRGRRRAAGRARASRASRAGSGGGRPRRRRARPGRGRARLPPADARPAAVRAHQPPPRRPDRPLPGRRDHRHPPRQERELPVRADAEHVQHGARATCATSRRGPTSPSPDRDVFDGLAAKLDRLFRDGRPGDRGDRAAGRRPRRGAPGAGRPARAWPARSGPPRRDLAAVPARRQVRLLQLAADVVPRLRRRAIDATLDDAHHREPYLAFLRDVLAGLRPILADDAVVVLVIGDVETDRGRRIRGGVGLAERVWEAPPNPRAIGWPASRSTTWPPTAR